MASPPSDFADAYRRLSPIVYAKALRLMGRPEDAADAVQEVAIKLHKNFAEFIACDYQMGWIYRVTTNTCLNLLRTRRRKNLDSSGDPDLLPSGRAEDQMISHFDMQKILGSLPERLQSYFVLSYVDGLIQDEICQVTGQSRSTVARGLRQLTDAIKEYYAGT